MLTRPTVAAHDLLVGDRLMASDALDPDDPVTAFPLIVGVERDNERGLVLVTVDVREQPMVLPADAAVVVEREQPM